MVTVITVITEVSEGATQFKLGDRVLVPFQISCGDCVNCPRCWTNAGNTMAPLAA
jgi:glutathione-independent formaldehyde dehydrogenase